MEDVLCSLIGHRTFELHDWSVPLDGLLATPKNVAFVPFHSSERTFEPNHCSWVQQEVARRAGALVAEALRQPIFLLRYPSPVIEPLPRLVSRFIAETLEKDRL